MLHSTLGGKKMHTRPKLSWAQNPVLLSPMVWPLVSFDQMFQMLRWSTRGTVHMNIQLLVFRENGHLMLKFSL